MEFIKSRSNFELISDNLSQLSQQLQVLILQKGYSWITQKLKDLEVMAQNNLTANEISLDEFDILMFEIKRIRSNPFFNLGSKSDLPLPESK
jgi:hypothetical protein